MCCMKLEQVVICTLVRPIQDLVLLKTKRKKKICEHSNICRYKLQSTVLVMLVVFVFSAQELVSFVTSLNL